MQAESAMNAVGAPTGAPTCPPCVASNAGLEQVSGAHEPGVVGSQPELPGPQASTVPPPVTRQPATAPTASLVPNASATASRTATTPLPDLTSRTRLWQLSSWPDPRLRKKRACRLESRRARHDRGPSRRKCHGRGYIGTDAR